MTDTRRWLAGWRVGGLAGFAFIVLLPHVVMACPGCKEALFDPGELQQKLSTAKGYAMSIGLLLAMPIGLIGGLTLLILRAHRRKRNA
jgi:hypothetical protein